MNTDRPQRIDERALTILVRAFNKISGNTDYDCQANLNRLLRVDGSW